ncbi:MAG TPA: hypothetical protein VLT33_47265 [Labilithrix sp.]|nr:hypothetical protein [Labilithrix sp.]
MLRAVRLVVSLGLASTACAAPRPAVPGPITSSEIASALTRPREHRDAPLGVRDTAGRPYALSQDEPVLGPAPPDGAERVVTVRALAKGCEDRYRVAPAQGPCWFAQTFTVRPTAGLPADGPEHDGSSVVGTVLGGAVILGAIGGTTYCSYKCPEPWDTAVPVGALTLVLAAIVVGAYAIASSMYVR